MLRMYTATSNALFSVKHGLGQFVSGQVQKVRDDESGATAIEYGLIAAGIAVVIIGGIALVGPKLKTMFTTIGGSL